MTFSFAIWPIPATTNARDKISFVTEFTLVELYFGLLPSARRAWRVEKVLRDLSSTTLRAEDCPLTVQIRTVYEARSADAKNSLPAKEPSVRCDQT